MFRTLGILTVYSVAPGIPACSNSGLGRADTSSAETGQGDTALPAGCPIVGSWQLTQVLCGSIEYEPWTTTYDRARLDVTPGPGGRCEVARVFRATDCRETERMLWDFPDDAKPGTPLEVAVTSEGVTECAPVDCLIEGVGVCSEGARANTSGMFQVTLEDEAPLEVVDDPPDGSFVAAIPGCPLEVVTRWSRP